MPITDEIWQTIAEPLIHERIKRLQIEFELNHSMKYFREVISCIKPSTIEEPKRNFAPFVFKKGNNTHVDGTRSSSASSSRTTNFKVSRRSKLLKNTTTKHVQKSTKNVKSTQDHKITSGDINETTNTSSSSDLEIVEVMTALQTNQAKSKSIAKTVKGINHTQKTMATSNVKQNHPIIHRQTTQHQTLVRVQQKSFKRVHSCNEEESGVLTTHSVEYVNNRSRF